MNRELTGLRRRLTPQDAVFYYLESDQAPMTLGSIAIFEGRVPFRRFVKNIESKLDRIPRYTQLVVEAPFNFARPTWEFDPHFDINHHIHSASLEPPGSDEQLTDLAARLFRGRLDRRRPLWEMHLVGGLSGGRTGLISRVHHCLVDGIGGVDLLMVTLDVSAKPSPAAQRPRRPAADPPGKMSLVLEGIADSFSEGVDEAASVARWLTDAATGEFTSSRIGARALGTALSCLARPVHKLAFNGVFSGQRKMALVDFPFDEVREVRRALGGTVNDIVLTVLAGALARYAALHGEDPRGKSARVLMPVNVRTETERSQLGNRLSMLLTEVPLGAVSPAECLHSISERTAALKVDRVAEGVAVVGQALGGLPPFALAGLAGALSLPNTMANMVCTNVPGPMIPLYTVGHEMLAHYPIMPIAWEMGIGCAVMSYNNRLYLAVMADAAAAPDAQEFAGLLKDAYDDLRAAAELTKDAAPAPVEVPERDPRQPSIKAAA